MFRRLACIFTHAKDSSNGWLEIRGKVEMLEVMLCRLLWSAFRGLIIKSLSIVTVERKLEGIFCGWLSKSKRQVP
tara:strand:+ start:473 stop:697 length:225 start_codon:yes stop_codon:yes gene_type:complete